MAEQDAAPVSEKVVLALTHGNQAE